MSTDLAVRDGATTTLFAGATPREVIEAATEAANELHSVIEQRRLSTRIGSSEHVRVEGWQALGIMTGVFAVEAGGVEPLPWPLIPNDGLPGPEDPGREPRRASPEWPAWKAAADRAAHWEEQQALIRARDRGLAFGFKASFRAVKDGSEVGWGEGRCTRSESNWAARTTTRWRRWPRPARRAKTLRQPLGFIVSLAGNPATPAEAGGAGGGVALPAPPPDALPVLDEAGVRETAAALQHAWPNLDAHKFMSVLASRLDGVPEAAGVALRAWAWWSGRTDEPNERSPAAQDAGGARGDAVSARLTPTAVAERELARCNDRLTRLRAEVVAVEVDRDRWATVLDALDGTNQSQDDAVEAE